MLRIADDTEVNLEAGKVITLEPLAVCRARSCVAWLGWAGGHGLAVS